MARDMLIFADLGFLGLSRDDCTKTSLRLVAFLVVGYPSRQLVGYQTSPPLDLETRPRNYVPSPQHGFRSLRPVATGTGKRVATLMQARTVAGRYELTGELGRGGFGTVWLGEDRLTGRTVAVKELRAPAGSSAGDRHTFGKRALLEARAAAQIQHPNAVILYDVVPASPGDDAVYLIMEYVKGTTLADEITRSGRLRPERVTALALQLLPVLETAHGLGIIHRDIKPSNIMITPDGQAKLADFGIAHIVGGTRLTSSSVVIGTVAYMAPEQFDKTPVTPASDLWSLGATLYHAAEGSIPFEGEDIAALLRAIVLDPVPEASAGSPLATVIAGLLTRDPAARLTIPQARQILGAAGAPGNQATHTITAPAGKKAPQVQTRHDLTVSPLQNFAGQTSQRRSSARIARYSIAKSFGGGDPESQYDPGPDPAEFSGTPENLDDLLGKVGVFPLMAVFLAPWCIFGNYNQVALGWILLAGGIIAFALGGKIMLTMNRERPNLLIGTKGIADKNNSLYLKWDVVSRIGPITEGGRTYLYVYAEDLTPRPLIRLCPLDRPRYPPVAIRNAILKHHPGAVVDPM